MVTDLDLPSTVVEGQTTGVGEGDGRVEGSVGSDLTADNNIKFNNTMLEISRQFKSCCMHH